jgi:predicted metal-dependent hydrolase
MEPEMRALWEWHAVEEIEHKSVAFDVYEAMGCGYFHRMFSAFVGVIIQGVFIIGSENRLMKDHKVKRFGVEGKKAGRFLAEILDLKKLASEFMLYFKPGFHPWDIDDRAFIGEWYQKYPEYPRQM